MTIASLDPFDPRDFDGTGSSDAHTPGPQPPRGSDGTTGGLATVMLTLLDKINEINEDGLQALPLTSTKLAAISTKTIASGAVTVTANYHALDTEAAAASDDLDTIDGTSNGSVIFVQLANAGHNVVIKHNTGNILCPGGLDITMDLTTDLVMIVDVGANLVACPLRLGTLTSFGLGAQLALTTNGNGAALIGIEDSAASITAATVEAALAELSARVRTQLVTVTAAAAAESANNIDVTINVVDLNGTAVSRVQRLLIEVFKADLTFATAAEYRLSETGAGAEISTTAKPSLLISTDASGDATVRVHDQAGASNAIVYLKITPVGVSGTYTHGTPTYVVLTFDNA